MKMNAKIAAVLIAMSVIVGLLVFHVVHYLVYCRYRSVPGKNHCSVCGHRKACRRFHHKNV